MDVVPLLRIIRELNKSRNVGRTSIPTNGLDLAPTLGPLYWGFLCSLVLTGINVVQGYLYFPSHDALHLQVVAAAMLMFNITSAALVSQSVYYYLVPHFGSLLPLDSITSELSAECLISTIITFISQGYFVVQLYGVTRLKRHMLVVPGFVAICSILACVFGVACTTVMIVHKHNVLATRSTAFSVFFGLAKGFGALTDIMATVAMCLMLASSKTGMSGTNSIIDTLMRYIMQRGVLVALIQTLLLITFHAAPDHLYWLAFHVNVTKLYANTFFSMLNGREQLNQQRAAAKYVSSYSNTSIGSRERKSKIHFNAVRAHRDSQIATADEIELDMRRSGAGDKSIPMPTITKTVVIREL